MGVWSVTCISISLFKPSPRGSTSSITSNGLQWMVCDGGGVRTSVHRTNHCTRTKQSYLTRYPSCFLTALSHCICYTSSYTVLFSFQSLSQSVIIFTCVILCLTSALWLDCKLHEGKDHILFISVSLVSKSFSDIC